MGGPSWKEGPHDFAWMYATKMWRQLRKVHLQRNPLCGKCLEQGRTTAATVVHHMQAHRGDWSLFRDPANLQSVCELCHNGELQFIEKRGYSNRIGADGWPVDGDHPTNKT